MSDYYDSIPEITKNTIDNYVQNKTPMGGFLNAVFENNLVDAVSRADNENLEALPIIVKYMYNKCPSVCWGGKENISNWLNS